MGLVVWLAGKGGCGKRGSWQEPVACTARRPSKVVVGRCQCGVEVRAVRCEIIAHTATSRRNRNRVPARARALPPPAPEGKVFSGAEAGQERSHAPQRTCAGARIEMV